MKLQGIPSRKDNAEKENYWRAHTHDLKTYYKATVIKSHENMFNIICH
jgi:hypothetical protein